ncbi:MAG: 50S ribosomal protein L24 [Puniceicoccales bacterium]|nr:50S ribosomal protein L24 [Puniceicoccales bacterium]
MILASTGLGLIFGATIIYVFIGRIGKFINGGMQQYREGDMVVVLRGTHKSTTSRISRLLEDRNQVVIEFETKGKIETETFFDFQVLRIK